MALSPAAVEGSCASHATKSNREAEISASRILLQIAALHTK